MEVPFKNLFIYLLLQRKLMRSYRNSIIKPQKLVRYEKASSFLQGCFLHVDEFLHSFCHEHERALCSLHRKIFADLIFVIRLCAEKASR